MNEIIIVLLILLFIVFLKMGITSQVKKSKGRKIYYSLSIIFLIGALLMFAFSTWDFGDFQKRDQTAESSIHIVKS